LAFLVKEIFFSFLVGTLNNELVLEFLACATDTGRGVFEDELGVAFDRTWADEIELALGDLDE